MTQNTTKKCSILRDIGSSLFGLKNAQGVDFRSNGAQNFVLWKNVTSYWFDLKTKVVDLLVEEYAAIVWPSPSGTKTRKLGFYLSWGSCKDNKHVVLDSLFNSILKE